MNSKLIFVPSFLIFVSLTTMLIIAPMQSEPTTGNQSFFEIGNFNGPQVPLNNTASTASVANLTSHFAAQVFIHKNFTGNNTTITQKTPIISSQFQDSISSLIITIYGNQSAGYMVEVCEHKSYAGNCMILGPGKHNVQTSGWLNDQISSIRALSPQTLDLKNIQPEIITKGSN